MKNATKVYALICCIFFIFSSPNANADGGGLPDYFAYDFTAGIKLLDGEWGNNAGYGTTSNTTHLQLGASVYLSPFKKDNTTYFSLAIRSSIEGVMSDLSIREYRLGYGNRFYGDAGLLFLGEFGGFKSDVERNVGSLATSYRSDDGYGIWGKLTCLFKVGEKAKYSGISLEFSYATTTISSTTVFANNADNVKRNVGGFHILYVVLFPYNVF
ncbi:MAG: hypothetical protein OEZ43_21870 [Gammaproteobacteria bacterium]|nr:hypothetical protein [Gammaproteobacteria bacterium]